MARNWVKAGARFFPLFGVVINFTTGAAYRGRYSLKVTSIKEVYTENTGTSQRPTGTPIQVGSGTLIAVTTAEMSIPELFPGEIKTGDTIYVVNELDPDDAYSWTVIDQKPVYAVGATVVELTKNADNKALPPGYENDRALVEPAVPIITVDRPRRQFTVRLPDKFEKGNPPADKYRVVMYSPNGATEGPTDYNLKHLEWRAKDISFFDFRRISERLCTIRARPGSIGVLSSLVGYWMNASDRDWLDIGTADTLIWGDDGRSEKPRSERIMTDYPTHPWNALRYSYAKSLEVYNSATQPWYPPNIVPYSPAYKTGADWGSIVDQLSYRQQFDSTPLDERVYNKYKLGWDQYRGMIGSIVQKGSFFKHYKGAHFERPNPNSVFIDWGAWDYLMAEDWVATWLDAAEDDPSIHPWMVLNGRRKVKVTAGYIGPRYYHSVLEILGIKTPNHTLRSDDPDPFKRPNTNNPYGAGGVSTGHGRGNALAGYQAYNEVDNPPPQGFNEIRWNIRGGSSEGFRGSSAKGSDDEWGGGLTMHMRNDARGRGFDMNWWFNPTSHNYSFWWGEPRMSGDRYLEDEVTIEVQLVTPIGGGPVVAMNHLGQKVEPRILTHNRLTSPPVRHTPQFTPGWSNPGYDGYTTRWVTSEGERRTETGIIVPESFKP